ncbi:component of gems protein 1-like [Helianthus annuus]|uniref:component of gems protein 1-like n=1 Tax=Helianthus annuus TaxID=4232 RepID=UPI000B8F6957|nr:component of gems protein 1-like [Helianthus annuus]
MDEDTDLVEPASGTPNHPIEISDGSSFHGSPYRGPDSYQARFNQYEWYFTPSEHSSPYQQQQQQQQQDPSMDSRFVAPAHTHYNYASVDPYQEAWDYNARHPEGPYGGLWTTGYPTYGYQHPPPPQPLYQPPQPQLIPPERQQEVLERLNQVEQEVREDRRE